MVKMTTNRFVSCAKLVHGNKYDYSKVCYINPTTRVSIICPKHGELQQFPYHHLRGCGCKKCNYNPYNTQTFIEEASIVHNNKYDYSKTVYVKTHTKVIIICPEHGGFEQFPLHHLKGHGCKECAYISSAQTQSLGKHRFIEKSNMVHDSKFNYSKVLYINNRTKVKIICPEHGAFTQTPDAHIRGQGCPKCGGVSPLNTKMFIDLAIKIHGDKYDYSKTDYKAAHKKVTIVCPEHGEFKQRASHHLSGHGCSICTYSVSKPSQMWLDRLEVPVEHRESSIRINGKLYRVDALDKENKVVYEFNDDFWHGNPKKYDPNGINPINKIKFGELYDKTIKKREDLENNGYTVISIWESDFD